MAISMSPRENYLACLNHQPHEYTPGPGDTAAPMSSMIIERPSGFDGFDGFGVRWVAPLSGGAGSALPAPGEFILDDVTKWKSVIKMPDLASYDWEGWAEADEQMLDRDMQGIEMIHTNCIYERMATFMGFEEALYSMIAEPEASYELLEALTEQRIEQMKYIAKYYKPDVYKFFDDVATERWLFISPDLYRALLKPLHTRMCDAAKELGMIPVQHTCGRADLLVQDMIDEGCHGWDAVQSQNDLVGIIEEHGDHFVLFGGYNTTGAPGQPFATEEMVRAEVRRCMETYAKYGKGYVFGGLVLTIMDPTNPFDMGPMNAVIMDEFQKCRAEQVA